MAKFFIDRPIFAWVIALFIVVLGSVAITQLPVAQYPPVAPPSIVVSATYPGASAKTLEESVISVIEQEMNGSPGLIYIESVGQANGTGNITLSFEPGTNPDLAQVDVQNRLSRAAPRLPLAVTQQGVRVDKARSNFLLFAILSSDDPAWTPVELGDYASRAVLPELQRVPGVGQAQLFGTEQAMRVWIDPQKLAAYNLSEAAVSAAIRAQNAQVSAGSIGELPNLAGQGIAATVIVNGQLVLGPFGNAGELGHSIIVIDGRHCTCGRRGCLEAYVSIRGMRQTYLELADSTVLLKDDGVKPIADAASRGEDAAVQTFRDTARWLAVALANAVAHTCPARIILFGGIARNGDVLMNPLKRMFERDLLNIYQGKVEILLSGLPEDDAGILGAAALADQG